MKTQKKSRKTTEFESRKAYILECAEGLFATQGYDSTSMAMIAERSEFAVGTIYNFFSSKNEIYDELVTLKLIEMKLGLDAISKTNSDPLEKIKDSTGFILEFFCENNRFLMIYLDDLTRLGWNLKSNLGEKVREQLFDTLSIFTSFIEEAVKKKIFRKNVSTEKILIIYMQILLSYLLYGVKVDGKVSELANYKDEIFEIFMNGIGAENA